MENINCNKLWNLAEVKNRINENVTAKKDTTVRCNLGNNNVFTLYVFYNYLFKKWVVYIKSNTLMFETATGMQEAAGTMQKLADLQKLLEVELNPHM
jgi:hypothetical protein